MNYWSILRESIQTVNRNYLLVIIQTSLFLLAFILFIFIVGLPVIMVFYSAGIELSEFDFKKLFKILTDGKMLTKYLFYLVIILLSLFTYFVISWLLIALNFSGTFGSLKRIIIDREDFSKKLFIESSRKYFQRFIKLSIIGALIMLMVFFLLGVVNGISKTMVADQSFIQGIIINFIKLFFSLLSFLFLIFFMALLIYTAIKIVIEEKSITDAMKESFNLLTHKLSSLIFYGALQIGFIIVMIISGIPSTILTSFTGFIIHQFILSVLQIYLNTIIIATLIRFYSGLMTQKTSSQKVL